MTTTELSNFPHVTQIGTGSNNCGPSAAAAVSWLYTGQKKFVADLIPHVKPPGQPGAFSSMGGVLNGIEQYGVDGDSLYGIHPSYLSEFLFDGRPVIVLVDNSAFSFNPAGYKYAHIVVLCGIVPSRSLTSEALVMDPLFSSLRTIPWSEFALSFTRPSKYVLFDDKGRALRNPDGSYRTGQNRTGVCVVPRWNVDQQRLFWKIESLSKEARYQ